MRTKFNPVGTYERENDGIDQLVIQVKSKPVTHIVIQHVAEALVNRGHGTVAILEGAKVVTSDGTPVGYIDQILAQPEENGPQHYLVASGLLLRERKLVPIEWIHSFGQDEVRLTVGALVAQDLQDYPQPSITDGAGG